MIWIKTEEQIENIRYSCKVLGSILSELGEKITSGLSLLEIDQFAEEYICSHGGTPAFKGFHGFPNTVCASVNENVIHGIPTNYSLKEGDIVGIDVGMIYKGGYGDTARTFAVGEVSEELDKLLQVTEQSLYKGITQARDGNRVGDISYAIQKYVEQYGKYSLVRDYCGHGVGIELWEEPSIPNYGTRGLGPRLKSNMVVAIEPMVNLGSHEVFVQSDGWTVTTKDHAYSAHFEHTLLIRDGEAEVLSKPS